MNKHRLKVLSLVFKSAKCLHSSCSFIYILLEGLDQMSKYQSRFKVTMIRAIPAIDYTTVS